MNVKLDTLSQFVNKEIENRNEVEEPENQKN